MMQLSLPVRAFLYIAGPQILEVVKDMMVNNVTAENLQAIKTKLYEVVKTLTGKTAFTWDDDLAVSLVAIFSKPEMIAKWGDLLFDPIEDWIKASETKWDDEALAPVISAFRIVAGIPDGDK